MRVFSKLVLLLTFVFSFANAKEFIIDNTHTHIGFSIKHLMISNVKGNFNNYTAEIDFDPATKTFKKLNAKIETASVDTGIVKRDDHLRSADFFDVEKFKTISFVMTGMKDSKIVGNLTIRDITKEVVLTPTINGVIKFQNRDRVGFTLEGKINRKDFGLTWNKALETGGVMVGEDVLLIVDVEAIEL